MGNCLSGTGVRPTVLQGFWCSAHNLTIVTPYLSGAFTLGLRGGRVLAGYTQWLGPEGKTLAFRLGGAGRGGGGEGGGEFGGEGGGKVEGDVFVVL